MRLQKRGLIAKGLRKISPKIKEEQDKFKSYDIRLNNKKIGNVQTYLESKESLNIGWLGIKEKERGKHYAQTVMDYIIKESTNNGLRQITLEVPGNSKDARHIYEKKRL